MSLRALIGSYFDHTNIEKHLNAIGGKFEYGWMDISYY